MIPLTLARYFAMRFLAVITVIFTGVFLLVLLVDYVELMRRASDVPSVSTWLVAKTSLFGVPEETEPLLPFTILVGAMTCYLNLSRRHELVVARSAGISAWQFIAPALVVALTVGGLATTVYNPFSAALREQSKRLETDLFGARSPMHQTGGGFWLHQKSADGQAIINAVSSREQGTLLGGVTVFVFDEADRFRERIEANRAELQAGHWRLDQARIYASGSAPREFDSYSFSTNITREQVRESFATPETVSFWELPMYIESAERAGLAAAGYRLQYQLLLARPLLLVAMVMLATSVSLRYFRFGGASPLILSGIGAGFLIYGFSKLLEDLSKAELMHPMAAAWLPVFVGGLTGFIVLLYQEDG
jgi:lipopolysaccharide export system permease protein